MAKENNKTILYVIIAAAVILLFMKGQGGLFSGLPSPGIEITPTPSVTYSTCSQLCQSQNFDNGYSASSITNCKAGESFAVYGYTGESALLKCCCYNTVTSEGEEEPGEEPEPIICSDSDSGLSPFEEQLKTFGTCTDSSGTHTDYCYEGSDHLIEYYCGPLASPIETQTCLGPGGSFNCPGMIPGSHCDAGKCVISGGGTMTDAECIAYMDSLGKQFWANDDIDTIDSCEMLVWFHCQSIGKTLLYFDYNSGCCVWSCT